MSQKRQPEEEAAEEGPSDPSSPGEKRQKLRGVIMEALRMHRLQKFLEPLIRKVVKEEVESALTKHISTITRPCGNQVNESTSRSLQLQFKNKLSLPIFTGARIEGEDCFSVTIAMVDALSGQVVTSGPESSAKVEIVVLEGDFEGDEEDNWTYEGFKINIVREREGKRSLLTGDVLVDLDKGIGVIGELSFTDNSSWTRSRKFKLGARVADGCLNGVNVKEAKTESFMVKDHRGELYKKHHPPSLHDEVWRLEKIGKDGAFHKRLNSANINTVKDFLLLLCVDAAKLRNILGSGMSTRMWDVTVEHARTCTLNDQVFVYYSNEQRKSVVFNVFGEVTAVLCEQQIVPFENLLDNEKVEAHAIAKLAYEHWSDVRTCDKGALFSSNFDTPSFSLPFGSQSFTEDMSIDFPSPGYDFSHSAIQSPDIFSMSGMRTLDAYPTNGVGILEPRCGQDSQSLNSCDLYKGAGDLEKLSTLVYEDCSSQSLFGEEQPFHYLDPSVSFLSPSPSADWSADLGTAVRSFMSSQKKAGRRKAGREWGMLYYVLNFAKKIVALKKTKVHGN